MKDINQSKRSFIKKSSAIGAGLMMANISTSVRAHEPEKKKPAQAGRYAHGQIVGHGDFKYKVNYHWGNLDPAKTPVENSHGLAIDSKGRIILVTDSDVNNFIIYNKDGKLLDAWGTQYPGAHSVKVVNENGEDFIYIVDGGWVLDRNRTSNKWKGKWYKQSGFVSKLTIDGKLVYTLGHPMTIGIYEPGQPFQPTDIAIAPNGDLYVTDGYGSDYVIQYDSHGRYIRHWGGWQNDNASLNLKNTHGIGIDLRDKNNPHLLISSRAERCLKQYSMSGEFLQNLELPGAYVGGPIFKGDHFYAPVCWSHINGKQAENSGFITILDKNNKVVSNPGGTEPVYKNGVLQPMQSTFDVFNHCHAVCVDDDENLYVGQWNANQVYPIKLERI